MCIKQNSIYLTCHTSLRRVGLLVLKGCAEVNSCTILGCVCIPWADRDLLPLLH